MDGNNNHDNVPINLQGILVGNGLTVVDIDLNTPMPTFAYHGLVPWYLWQQIQTVCQGNYISNDDPNCNELLNKAQDSMGDIDPYGKFCDYIRNSIKIF
jgi:hypothetical protein